MNRPLNLERFASISAELDLGVPRDRVLGAAGVAEETWEATAEFWLGRMASDATKDRLGLSQRYAKLFVAHRAEHHARLHPKTAPSVEWKPMGQVARAIPVARAEPPEPATSAAHPHATQEPDAAPPPQRPAYAARLSVEQFASLRAEIVNQPDTQHAETRARYGLDAETWPLEESHWQQRFAGDKSLFQTYLQRFQYFRALMQPRS